MIDKAVIDRLLELGGTKPVILTAEDDAGIPFVVVPGGCEIKSLMPLMPLHHIKRTVTLDDVKSFCDYVNAYKEEQSLVFCAIGTAGCTFRAILDYHIPDSPSAAQYCDHIATYTTKETPEWTLWMGNDRKPKGQEEFASFLEENAYLFQQPSGAELIELVTNLYATKGVSYTGGIRLKSGGATINYDEQIELSGATSAKPGRVELPSIISVGISPFIGAPTYQVDARLKYSLPNRSLMLRYETITPHIIVRDSIKLLVDKVGEVTKIIPLMGNP